MPMSLKGGWQWNANLLRLYTVQLYKVNNVGNIWSQGKSEFNLAAEFFLFPNKETLV